MADVHLLEATVVVVEEHVSFTLPALCRACGAEPELLESMVSEGLLRPAGQGPADWQFAGDALPQARRAARLARDLELDLPAVVLVMDLLAEIDRLRARLARFA
ncbi:MAG: MerR family transcriptional regulator [Burkholderiales bacterium]|nr:MAG: MerR family transcriptional regulator [Burkholderiales bacterium]